MWMHVHTCIQCILYTYIMRYSGAFFTSRCDSFILKGRYSWTEVVLVRPDCLSVFSESLQWRSSTTWHWARPPCVHSSRLSQTTHFQSHGFYTITHFINHSLQPVCGADGAVLTRWRCWGKMSHRKDRKDRKDREDRAERGRRKTRCYVRDWRFSDWVWLKVNDGLKCLNIYYSG